MKEEIKELVKYRLTRAEDTLADAKILFDKDRLFSAVNRIYYALFYSANALLLTRGLSSVKHSGVLSLFNYSWIERKSLYLLQVI